MVRKGVYLMFVIVLLFTIQTSAYIDPGTGGMIAGSIWPLILTILGIVGGFFVKYFFKPIKSGTLRIWKKLKRNE